MTEGNPARQLTKEGHHDSTVSLKTYGAGGEARTRTGVTTHGILSPRRLPIPPLRQLIY